MRQVIVTDLFDWFRKNTSTSASFGLQELVATFFNGSEWRPIDAIVAQWYRDQPNEWGKLHAPSNCDGPFRLDSPNTFTSASFGLQELVATFFNGSEWRPIDAIIAQWHRDQPNKWK
jgi:hypothetical protein